MDVPYYRMESLPATFPLYIRSVLGQRRYDEQQGVPKTRLEWPRFQFNAESIRAYAKVCECPFDGRQVPLLFAHSYFGPLHLQMLMDENFPLKVLGSVHLRNHVLQHRPLLVNSDYEARLAFTEQRRRPQGLEVDLKTEILQGQTLCWESVTTLLFRRKFQNEDPESDRASMLSKLQNAAVKGQFAVPASIGKKFAWITRDVNPIHMSRYLAKIFGFERDLCHGMWALGRSVSFCDGIDWTRPVRSDVIFKGPLYMERDVSVKGSGDSAGYYELYSAGNDRPCVLARLINVEAGSRL